MAILVINKSELIKFFRHCAEHLLVSAVYNYKHKMFTSLSDLSFNVQFIKYITIKCSVYKARNNIVKYSYYYNHRCKKHKIRNKKTSQNMFFTNLIKT